MAEKLSREQITALEKKLLYYKCVRRSKANDALKNARALGDLEDNEEYHRAWYERERLEMQIRMLEEEIDRALKEVIADIKPDGKPGA